MPLLHFLWLSEKPEEGKKQQQKKSKKINSRGKINSWWILSLPGNIKHFQFNHSDEPDACRILPETTYLRWPKRRGRERVSYSKTKVAGKGAAACRWTDKNVGQDQKERHACAHRTFVEDELHTPECCKPSAQKQPRARGEAESTHLSECNLLGRANSSVVYLRWPNIHTDELFHIYFVKEKCKIKWRIWHFSFFFSASI